MNWFKFYGSDFLSDPKIARLSPLERSCWITILCLASMTEDGIIEFLTVETLLNKSGIQFDPYQPEEWERALSVLTKFSKMNMISTGEDGDISVLNWEKRQETNMTNAERQAKFRKKHNNKAIKEDSNERVTDECYESNARLDKRHVTKVTLDKNRGEENNTPSQIAKSFFSKEKEFDDIFEVFGQNMPKEVLEREFNKFILYWTEPNSTGTKERWQKEPTFDVKRRLYTWLSRSKEFNEKKVDNKYQAKSIEI